MKKVLITGGGGYIGTHIALTLIENGYDIHVLDNFSNSKIEAIEAVKKYTKRSFNISNIDIRDFSELRSVFRESIFDSVIHLAGLKSINDSISNPLDYYDNNILGSINLFKVMKEFGVSKIVFSSSATVYDQDNLSPIEETMNIAKINSPYGYSKMIIENILRDISYSAPWNILCLRYFNPIGAHNSGIIGEDPKNVANNLMPALMYSAFNKTKFNIHGDDYDTRDGTCVRDYIHITDLAEGHLKALSKLSVLNKFNAVNLGTGYGYTVKEVLEEFKKTNNLHIDYVVGKRRLGDKGECYAGVELAKELLGWEANLTLKDMCRDSWAWFCKSNQKS